MFLIASNFCIAQNTIDEINYLILTKKNEEALKLTQKFINKNPDNAHGYYQQTLIYKLNYKYPEAIQSIKTAIDLEPENIDYLSEYGALLLKRDREKDAIRIFEKVNARDSSQVFVGLSLANYYLKERKFKRAKTILHRLYASNTNNGYFARNLGLCYIKLSDRENSLKWLNKAVELDSTDIKAFEYLTLVYIALEKFDKALACLNKAKMVDPERKKLYVKAGDIHVMRNHNYQAVPEYLKALEMGPKDEFITKNLGVCYFKIKKYDKSKYYLKKALKLGLNDMQCYNYLGHIYSNNNKPDTANIYYNEALELLTPDNSTIFSIKEDMANNYYLMKNYLKAIEIYKEIIKLDLSDGYWGSYRKNKVIIDIAAIYSDKLNNKQKAIEYYKKVLEPEVTVNKNYYDFAQKQIKKLREELFFEGNL